MSTNVDFEYTQADINGQGEMLLGLIKAMLEDAQDGVWHINRRKVEIIRHELIVDGEKQSLEIVPSVDNFIKIRDLHTIVLAAIIKI